MARHGFDVLLFAQMRLANRLLKTLSLDLLDKSYPLTCTQSFIF